MHQVFACVCSCVDEEGLDSECRETTGIRVKETATPLRRVASTRARRQRCSTRQRRRSPRHQIPEAVGCTSNVCMDVRLSVCLSVCLHLMRVCLHVVCMYVVCVGGGPPGPKYTFGAVGEESVRREAFERQFCATGAPSGLLKASLCYGQPAVGPTPGFAANRAVRH